MLKVLIRLLNKLLILKKSQIVFTKPKPNNILIFDEKDQHIHVIITF